MSTNIQIDFKPAMLQWLRVKMANASNLELAALWVGYDNKDCGCSVNGVVVVQWMDNKHTLPDFDRLITMEIIDSLNGLPITNTVPVYYEPRSEWVLDPRLHLDYLPDTQRFRLTSDGQIFCS